MSDTTLPGALGRLARQELSMQPEGWPREDRSAFIPSGDAHEAPPSPSSVEIRKVLPAARNLGG